MSPFIPIQKKPEKLYYILLVYDFVAKEYRIHETSSFLRFENDKELALKYILPKWFKSRDTITHKSNNEYDIEYIYQPLTKPQYDLLVTENVINPKKQAIEKTIQSLLVISPNYHDIEKVTEEQNIRKHFANIQSGE